MNQLHLISELRLCINYIECSYDPITAWHYIYVYINIPPTHTCTDTNSHTNPHTHKHQLYSIAIFLSFNFFVAVVYKEQVPEFMLTSLYWLLVFMRSVLFNTWLPFNTFCFLCLVFYLMWLSTFQLGQHMKLNIQPSLWSSPSKGSLHASTPAGSPNPTHQQRQGIQNSTSSHQLWNTSPKKPPQQNVLSNLWSKDTGQPPVRQNPVRLESFILSDKCLKSMTKQHCNSLLRVLLSILRTTFHANNYGN